MPLTNCDLIKQQCDSLAAQIIRKRNSSSQANLPLQQMNINNISQKNAQINLIYLKNLLLLEKNLLYDLLLPLQQQMNVNKISQKNV
jgi:hypothetical protein